MPTITAKLPRHAMSKSSSRYYVDGKFYGTSPPPGIDPYSTMQLDPYTGIDEDTGELTYLYTQIISNETLWSWGDPKFPKPQPTYYHDFNGTPHSTLQARDYANAQIQYARAYNEAASNNGNNYPSLDALEYLWNEYQKEGSQNKMAGVKEYIDQWKMGQAQANQIDDIDQLEQLWSDYNNGGYKGCLKPISYRIKELQGLKEARKPEYNTIEKLKQLKKDYQDGGYLQHALGVEKQVNLIFSENMQKARYIQESQRVLGEDVWSENECILQAENDKFIHEAYKYHKKDI